MNKMFHLLPESWLCSPSRVRGPRQLLLLLICFVLTGPVGAQNSQAVRKMKAERTELKKQIEASEQLLRSTRKDVTSQLSNLVLLDAQILGKQNYITRLKTDADSLTGAINLLGRQLDTLQTELTACKANYRRAMTFVSRNKIKQSRWMFVLMAKDFRELYRRMRYASQYSKYQRVQGEVILEKERMVRKKKASLLRARKEKEQLLEEGRLQQDDLEKKKEKRKEMVDKLNEKQKSIQSVIRRNKNKYKDIDLRIDRLIKQEIAAAERRRKEAERKRKLAEERRRREEAAARKRENSVRKSEKTPSVEKKVEESRTKSLKFNEADNAETQLNSNFAANKGRLPVPITGGYAITSRYGTYNVDGLKGVRLENKGINITGQKGAQARSVYDGEVVVVANFGRAFTVIIRHGDYYSVYNNLSSVSVRRDQKVTTGQHLGRVGTDNTGNCVLHFQLRHKTTTLNPQSWIR